MPPDFLTNKNKSMEKDATIKISLKADSGYSCDIKGRIGLDQWEQINTIIDSDACVPNLQSELEKAKELLKECKEQLESIPLSGIDRDDVNRLIVKLKENV